MIDVARAKSMVAEDEPALQYLLSAEQAAPQLVRHNPGVRETVKALHRRAPITGGTKSSPLAPRRTRRALQGVAVTGERPTLGLLVTAAGGTERIREKFVQPAIEAGWSVAIIVSPTAATWLDDLGERQRARGDPPATRFAYNPACPGKQARTHRSTSTRSSRPVRTPSLSWPLGLADNQLLTAACEAIGGQSVPVVVFPRVNAAHARQPMWEQHITALRSVGVHLVYGEHVWPLHEPRQAPPGKEEPWPALLQAVNDAYVNRPDPA